MCDFKYLRPPQFLAVFFDRSRCLPLRQFEIFRRAPPPSNRSEGAYGGPIPSLGAFSLPVRCLGRSLPSQRVLGPPARSPHNLLILLDNPQGVEPTAGNLLILLDFLIEGKAGTEPNRIVFSPYNLSGCPPLADGCRPLPTADNLFHVKPRCACAAMTSRNVQDVPARQGFLGLLDFRIHTGGDFPGEGMPARCPPRASATILGLKGSRLLSQRLK